MTSPRRSPLYLNPEPLDKLVASAGMSFDEFARLAGVTGKTLSYARNGHPVRISTLRKLAVGLTRLKTMKGLEGLVTVAPSPNDKEKAAVA